MQRVVVREGCVSAVRNDGFEAQTCSNWLLPSPGSPHIRTWMSPRMGTASTAPTFLRTPPSNASTSPACSDIQRCQFDISKMFSLTALQTAAHCQNFQALT